MVGVPNRRRPRADHVRTPQLKNVEVDRSAVRWWMVARWHLTSVTLAWSLWCVRCLVSNGLCGSVLCSVGMDEVRKRQHFAAKKNLSNQPPYPPYEELVEVVQISMCEQHGLKRHRKGEILQKTPVD